MIMLRCSQQRTLTEVRMISGGFTEKPVPAWPAIPVLAVTLLVLPLNLQSRAQPGGASLKPSFDVVSIKPVDQCGQSFSPQPGARVVLGFGPPKFQPGGRYIACGSLTYLIVDTYQTEGSQVTGGPDWTGSAQYQIEARAEESASKDQMRLMVQTLLEEKFNLKFHRESRETNVFSLVVAKDGPKLKEANCSTRLPGPVARAATRACARLARPRCSTSVPLGRPVEPDV